MLRSAFRSLALASGLAALATLSISAAAPGDGGSAVIRNGTGVNPEIYIPLNTPCIGETWQAEVDLTGIGWGLVITMAFPAPATGPIIPPYGELLLDPSNGGGFFLALTNSNEGYTLIEYFIPDDPSLIGTVVYTQALYNTVQMIPQLTNAVDITVGG